MVDPAALHPALQRARYGKAGADAFLGLWVNLLAIARQGVDARREVSSFFRGRDVVAAVDAAGEGAVQEQLADAAALYFQTCLTDPTFTSSMFGMKRLSVDEVQRKAAHEAADAVDSLAGSGALTGPAIGLPRALLAGFLEAMGPSGEDALRTALAKRPRVANYLP